MRLGLLTLSLSQDLLNSEVNRHHMFFVVVGAVLAALIGYVIKKSYY